MLYHVIYDGKCNLCSNLVQLLENLDGGERFGYIPMQDQTKLDQFNITAEDCLMGMILVDAREPERRWQGSEAVEQIGKILPGGELFVKAYQAMPGLKWAGDRIYEQVRDNRYQLFGKRDQTYESKYPSCCDHHPS